MLGTDGERDSGKSMQSVRLDVGEDVARFSFG